MKTCKACNLHKPRSAFRPDPRYRDGLGSWCAACHRARNSEWAKENRARLTAKAAAWRAANPEKALEIARLFHNRNKAKRAAAYAQWAKANAALRRAAGARRKAAKLKATPRWADLAKIKAIYLAAPAGHDVDHIVPLVSGIVCGLHCETNLQYLPSALNQSKRNTWWPGMPRIAQAYAQGRLPLDDYKPEQAAMAL